MQLLGCGINFDASGFGPWARGTKRIKLNHKSMVGVPAKRRTAGGTQVERRKSEWLGPGKVESNSIQTQKPL